MSAKVVLFGILFFCVSALTAQNQKQTMIPLIGSEAPAFTAETTYGTLNFPGDFGKSWKILFSHPKDFTPVCTTEIMELSRLQTQFDALGVKFAVLSADTKYRHLLWIKSINEILSADKIPTQIQFPMIADSVGIASNLYGMIHPSADNTKTVRGVFILDPNNIIQAVLFYPMAVGRNMNEIVRTVEALQTTAETHLSTPANWEPGHDLVVPRYPYSHQDVENSPALTEEFYRVGAFLWYKKVAKP
jgi:peroxiredoxin (alkyl hydroperoxide reductase subunit C)